MLIDDTTMKIPSCSQQWATVSRLLRLGAEVRTAKGRPQKGKGPGFVIHHVKGIVVDRKVLMMGSCNFTHDSLTFCEETCTLFRTQTEVEKFLRRFAELWGTASPVALQWVHDKLAGKACRSFSADAIRDRERIF